MLRHHHHRMARLRRRRFMRSQNLRSVDLLVPYGLRINDTSQKCNKTRRQQGYASIIARDGLRYAPALLTLLRACVCRSLSVCACARARVLLRGCGALTGVVVVQYTSTGRCSAARASRTGTVGYIASGSL